MQAGVPGAPRPPVRLLHARHDHGRPCRPDREPGAGTEDEEVRLGARGQPLPLHRLPEHRQGDPGGGRRDAPGRPPPPFREAPNEAQVKPSPGAGQLDGRRPGASREDPKLITGQGRFTDVHRPAARMLAGLQLAARSPTPTSPASTPARPSELPGVVAVYTWARSWPPSGRPPCRAPGRCPAGTYPGENTHDPRVPDHIAGGQGPGPVHGRDRRRGRSRAAVSTIGHGRHRNGRRRLRRAAGGDRHRGGLGRRRPGHPRAVQQPDVHLGAAQRRRRQGLRRGPGGAAEPRYFHRQPGRHRLEPRAIVVQPVPAQGEFTVWTATHDPALRAGLPDPDPRHPRGPRSGSSPPGYSAAASAPSWRSTQRSSSPSPWPGSAVPATPIKWDEYRTEGYHPLSRAAA